MPRIDQHLLNSVIYLYPTTEDAQSGLHVGGTGFLASVPEFFGEPYYHFRDIRYSGRPRHPSTYAVTNSHVIREGRSPVIRLNSGETTDILPLDEHSWFHHPDGDDVAVAPLQFVREGRQSRSVPVEWFLADQVKPFDSPAVGDDVYFLGRFVTDDGKQRNSPTARFGSLAMLDTELVRNGRGLRQESYLVEARSLSGQSGSPVFLNIAGRHTWRVRRSRDIEELVHPRDELHLLGIVWGHISDYRRVLDANHIPLGEDWYVEQNTGVMGVVPARKIVDLFNDERLVEMRKAEAERRKKEEKEEVTGVADTAPDA